MADPPRDRDRAPTTLVRSSSTRDHGAAQGGEPHWLDHPSWVSSARSVSWSCTTPRSCRPAWTMCVNNGRAQRDRPGFRALSGRKAVFLRRPWEEADESEPQISYEHLGPDGRRVRRAAVYADGSTVRTGPD